MAKALLLFSILLLAACDDAIKTNFAPTAPSSGGSSFCPTNYVRVPARSPYTSADFCVAKYETKITGQANGDQPYSAAFVAEVRSSGTPWVNVNRAQAVTACQSLGAGYDLMLNAEWQSIAQNIELNAWNWNAATIGDAGGLSRTQGITNSQEAGSDSDPCLNTGASCSLTSWHSHRRVHQLSNGEYIWDIAGNVGEWMKDNHGFDFNPIVTSQITFNPHKVFLGSSGSYAGLNSDPFGGLGEKLGNLFRDGIVRYGAWGVGNSGALNAGIFSVSLSQDVTGSDVSIGFRCVYRPTSPSTYTILQPYLLPDDAASADPTSYELGVRFTSSRNGTITAIRFYRGTANAPGYTVSLWSGAGVLLESGSGVDGTIPGWQEISLTTPVSITAGSTYVASYYYSGGALARTPHGFRHAYLGTSYLTAVADGGVFNVGAGFPNSTFNETNYFVDAVFAPAP